MKSKLTGSAKRPNLIARPGSRPIRFLPGNHQSDPSLLSLKKYNLFYSPRYVTPTGVLKKTSSPRTLAPERVRRFPARIWRRVDFPAGFRRGVSPWIMKYNYHLSCAVLFPWWRISFVVGDRLRADRELARTLQQRQSGSNPSKLQPDAHLQCPAEHRTPHLSVPQRSAPPILPPG